MEDIKSFKLNDFLYEYKPYFYKYFFLILVIIGYIWYSSSMYSNDRIIEHLLLIGIIIVLIKYNGLMIDPMERTYHNLKNREKFIERLKKLYDEFAPLIRDDKFFYINKDNILNNREWTLFFILEFDNIIDIFQNIEYIRFYNNYLYMKIVHFTELFLYYYYYAISEKPKEECKDIYRSLKLLRDNIESVIEELEVDLPTEDKNNEDIDVSLFKAKRQLMYLYDSKLFLLSKYCDDLREYDMSQNVEMPYNA